MNNIKKYLIIASLAAAGMTSASNIAAADTDSSDRKVFSADVCKGRAGVQTIDSWRGRTFNSDSQAQWIHCPVVRDVVTGSSSTTLTMKVVDRHYSEDVRCGFWSQNVDSGDGWSGFSSGRRSSGSGAHVQTLSFAPLMTFAANSSYTIECAVPGVYENNKSQLVAYSTTEN